VRVGIGVTVYLQGRANKHMDGIGYYTKEIFDKLKNLSEMRPIVFGRSEFHKLDDKPVFEMNSYASSAAFSGITNLPFLGTGELAKKIDIFHATDHRTPKLRGVPVVATLMDAIPLSHPQWTNQNLRQLKNWLWRKSGQWADHIITISDFSRVEISKFFKIPESKISVIHLGVDGRYFERLSEVDSSVLLKYALPEKFFLFVGTLQPRKNIERIVLAHELLPPSFRAEYPLIIVGSEGWGCGDLIAKLNSFKAGDSIRWLKNVDDYEKRVLMQRSTALVYPSLIEGFGLPVLEGFASQTPVITSNSSSIPEVAGDAAWLLDPLNVKEIAEAMYTIANDKTLANDFVNKGISRVKKFSWDLCAQKTFKIYEKLV
jgi:alpha-1,3-rhamnosyl/mannosyltransferase